MEELPTPTGRELEILKVLWERGPSSVRTIHLALVEASGEDPAYNTVQTFLRLMESKHLVTHTSSGRTFIYTANFSREESATRYLDRVFDGAASQLMLTLMQAERISSEELDQMHRMIAEARKQRLAR